MIAKLTNAAIASARKTAASTGKRVEVWDETVAGLFVRVSPSAVATFYVKYRAHGQQRKLKLGAEGQSLAIDEARKEARKVLGAVARGGDPQADRHALRETPTLAVAIDKYIASLNVAPRTLATYRQRLKTHVVPALGRRLVTDVTAADVRRLHKRITDGTKTQKGRSVGGHVAANRTVEGLRAFYSWAMVEWPALVRVNPAARIKRNAEEKRSRIISPEERKVLLDAIAAAEAKPVNTEGHVSPSYANAFRLALMTGMRPIDLVTLRHENITRAVAGGHKVWVAEWGARGEAKTKKANTRRVLNSAAIEIIEAQAKLTGGTGWVFPSSRGTQTTSNQLSRTFRELRDAAKLPAEVTLYVAGRHTYVSEAVMAGIPLAVIGADVDNASAVHRYAHLQRAVDEGVSEKVLAVLRGSKG